MLFRLVLGLTALVFITSACNKNVQPDNQTPDASVSGGGDQPATTTAPDVGTAPMSFDPQGSDSGKISGLATIFFEYDKSALSSDSKSKLKGNADWMKKNSSSTLQIEGHCDARGSVEYNLALGDRRAKAVKNYLESLGVEGRRMTIISYGKEKPMVSGDSESAFAKNRRANFVPLQ